MSDFSEKTSRRSTTLRILGTLLAVALLVYLLSQQGWTEIWQAVQKVPLWRFGLAIVLLIISRLSVVMRWHVLLRSAGTKATFHQSLRVTLAGLFASNFLPTTVGGDVVRLAGALQLRFDAAVSAASLIVDRLVGMAGMVMVAPFGLSSLLASPRISGQAINGTAWFFGLQTGSWFTKVKEKVQQVGRHLLSALAFWLKQPRFLALAFACTWVHMVCLFSIFYLFFEGMGEKIPFWLIAGLYSLSYFVTLIPISINGYGVQEVSLTFIFSSLAGVSVSSSLTMALLYRTLMMVASLPGAFFVPGIVAAREK